MESHQAQAPLADRMRPRTLDEFVGQNHLVDPGKILHTIIHQDRIPSLIFWGPPGTGKTTLAHIIAHHTNAEFEQLSAVLAGVKDIREVVERAKQSRNMLEQKRTILFIDEIHRFNKAQQDSLLPHVENGNLILIGATTENPSFEVNSALLSRSRVFTLQPLSPEDIEKIISQALADKDRGLGNLNIQLDTEALQALIQASNGDARTALNTLEVAVHLAHPANLQGTTDNTSPSARRGGEWLAEEKEISLSQKSSSESKKSDSSPWKGEARRGSQSTIPSDSPSFREQPVQQANEKPHPELKITNCKSSNNSPLERGGLKGRGVSIKISLSHIKQALQRTNLLYDRAGEEHYNTISAFIKSMRASNPDAALYYLARMVEAGEDPKFIARRMVIFASEDIGMAQPTALVVANEVFRAVETIGYPECAINLAHGVAYLATAKKDRSAYDAFFQALDDVKRQGNLPIPLELRNAPTKLMKDLGYGKGYNMYPDPTKSLLPDKLKDKKYFK